MKINGEEGLHLLLEKIVTLAETGDKKELLQLSLAFDQELARVTQGRPLNPLQLQYDQCRQSCIAAYTYLNGEKELLVKDAEQKWLDLQQQREKT